MYFAKSSLQKVLFKKFFSKSSFQKVCGVFVVKDTTLQRCLKDKSTKNKTDNDLGLVCFFCCARVRVLVTKQKQKLVFVCFTFGHFFRCAKKSPHKKIQFGGKHTHTQNCTLIDQVSNKEQNKLFVCA